MPQEIETGAGDDDNARLKIGRARRATRASVSVSTRRLEGWIERRQHPAMSLRGLTASPTQAAVVSEAATSAREQASVTAWTTFLTAA